MKIILYCLLFIFYFCSNSHSIADEEENKTNNTSDTLSQIEENKSSEFIESILPPEDSFPEGTNSLREKLKEAFVNIRTSAEQDEDSGLFVQPNVKPGRVGFKTIEERFSWKTRIVPVYEYETYTVMERNTSGELVEVKKRRIIKQIGTKEEKYLVKDPEGSIYKTIKVPIIDKNAGPTELNPGLIGQNALCVYISIKMGIPYDETINSNCLWTLSKYIDQAGLPDNTFDLACLTLLFVNLPQDKKDYGNLTSLMLNKLLLGQVSSKKGQNLWGPICINNEILAKLQLAEREYLQKDYEKVKEKFNSAPENKKMIEIMDKEKQKLESFQKQIIMGFSQIIPKYKVGRPGEKNPNFRTADYYTYGKNDAEPGINISNYIFYPYAETIADIESTAFVSLALHEAAKKKLLPKMTISPLSPNGKPLSPPKNVSQILKNNIDTLISLKEENGTWSELNLYFTVHEYDKLAYPYLPANDKNKLQLPSNSTPMSKCLANASLLLLNNTLKYLEPNRKSLDVDVTGIFSDLKDFNDELFQEKEDIQIKPYYSLQYLFFASEIIKNNPEMNNILTKAIENTSSTPLIKNKITRTGLVRDATSSMMEYLKLVSESEKKYLEEKQDKKGKKEKEILMDSIINKTLAHRGFLFSPEILPDVYKIMIIQNIINNN